MTATAPQNCGVPSETCFEERTVTVEPVGMTDLQVNVRHGILAPRGDSATRTRGAIIETLLLPDSVTAPLHPYPFALRPNRPRRLDEVLRGALIGSDAAPPTAYP